MRRVIVSLPVLLALISWAGQARAEWFYFGAHAGYQYFDMDALSGGDVYDQALDSATESFNADNPDVPDIDQPQPRHYSAESAFVWGLYAGLNVGRVLRIGARMTHSFMEVTPEGEGINPESEVAFDLDLLTVMLELQIRIPIRFVVPFIGIGAGYAFLGTDGAIVAHGQSEYFEDRTDCVDLQAAVGIDFDIGDHFSLGVAAHFNFIGFYYEDPDNPAETEAAWGFVNDYMLRATFRI